MPTDNSPWTNTGFFSVGRACHCWTQYLSNYGRFPHGRNAAICSWRTRFCSMAQNLLAVVSIKTNQFLHAQCIKLFQIPLTDYNFKVCEFNSYLTKITYLVLWRIKRKITILDKLRLYDILFHIESNYFLKSPFTIFSLVLGWRQRVEPPFHTGILVLTTI